MDGFHRRISSKDDAPAFINKFSNRTSRSLFRAAPSEAAAQKHRNANDKGGKKERQKYWSRRVDECHPSELIGI